MDRLICIDAGTTNTRGWLTEGERILARARAAVGVGDTARDGSPAKLHSALHDLIAELRGSSNHHPAAVIAAGMVTSSLGLAEVPHLEAPAGLEEIARSVQSHSFPGITDLPVLLVPGVRTGPKPCDLETVSSADLMRGEETLCLGLVESGVLHPPGVVLNLGSHWKIIRIDSTGRIAGSLTSLAGELIHAAQTRTILASALPDRRPDAIDSDWLDAGMREERQSGLSRALFCVRLLEQSGQGSPDQRLSFLIGAFIASELDAFSERRVITSDTPVIITGGMALSDAWVAVLAEHGTRAVALADDRVERALLAGLGAIVRRHEDRGR